MVTSIRRRCLALRKFPSLRGTLQLPQEVLKWNDPFESRNLEVPSRHFGIDVWIMDFGDLCGCCTCRISRRCQLCNPEFVSGQGVSVPSVRDHQEFSWLYFKVKCTICSGCFKIFYQVYKCEMRFFFLKKHFQFGIMIKSAPSLDIHFPHLSGNLWISRQ